MLEMVADYQCHVGEGPLWHPDHQRLYWTDIPNGRVFAYDPVRGEHGPVYEGDVVGGMTLQTDGSLLFFMAGGAVAVWRADQAELDYVLQGIPGEEDSRFNDVIADPHGRVYAGTMASADHGGSLYHIGHDGTAEVVLADVGVPNGMGFAPGNTCFYFTDSRDGCIYRFDYDPATAALTNQQRLVVVDPANGVPDGMTVDREGWIWSARWDGGALFQYSGSGEVRSRHPFPARKVSSIAFGGPTLTDLYVTTAGGQNKAEEGSGAGALFRFQLPGVQGKPEYRSAIGLG